MTVFIHRLVLATGLVGDHQERAFTGLCIERWFPRILGLTIGEVSRNVE